MWRDVLEDCGIYDTTAFGRNCFMGTSRLFCSALKDKAAEMTLNFLSFDLNVVFFSFLLIVQYKNTQV